MSNLVKRILLAAIFIPALLVMIFFMPWYNHLVLNLLILGFAFIGAREQASMYRNRGIDIPPPAAGILGMIPPAVFYLEGTFTLPFWVSPLIIFLPPALLLAREGLARTTDGIESLIPRIPAALSLMIYPGLFAAFLLRITLLPSPAQAMVVFLALVFSNDSFAYFVGVAFGRNNKGIFPVSPNKSAAGFFGGWGGTMAAGVLITFILPDFWPGPFWTILPLAAGICLLSVVGDLVESVFKRSAGVKDSGTLLAGRGGVLDSLDSLIFAAPLYYYWISALG